MSEKHYPYYGGNFDRIIFDGDGSVWVSEAKLRDVESENASLKGAARGLGRLCDRYKAENDQLKSLMKLDESTISVLNACMDDLNAENFRLRELVRYAWDVALHPQLFGDGSYLLRRMCDLGIEDDS